MFTAEQYARVKEIMCRRHYDCEGCPLAREENEEDLLCTDFAIKYPAEAVKRVELWWMENKQFYPELAREMQ